MGGGGVLKQFIDSSCIYKINIPSQYRRIFFLSQFYFEKLAMYFMVHEFDIGKIVDFPNGHGICNHGTEVLYFVFVYKAFYFYEKLDNTVLCKDAIHSFMISSDPSHSILCTLTTSLSFDHSDFDTWFLSLPQNVTHINNGQFSIKLHGTAVSDVLIFCILYFVGIFKCSLLFINKLK